MQIDDSTQGPKCLICKCVAPAFGFEPGDWFTIVTREAEDGDTILAKIAKDERIARFYGNWIELECGSIETGFQVLGVIGPMPDRFICHPFPVNEHLANVN